MSTENFDVIVVGAGMAGICCAGELVLRGKKPLLICETTEVASTLRPCKVGEEGHGFLQHPVWGAAWGGGWWYPLARELNIPLRMHQSLMLSAMMKGTGETFDIPYLPTAGSITDILVTFSPGPVDEIRDTFEQLTYAALQIPWEELMTMDSVPMIEWMKDQGADEAISMMLLSLVANLLEIPMEHCQEVSVFGGWGILRTMLCGEYIVTAVEPDAQTGLAVPLCDAIEERGGAVWRSSRVADVLVSDGRVTGVMLESGREVSAPVVAIAAGNPRIPKILKPLPEEAVAPLAYSDGFTHNEDFTIYTLLNKPVIPTEMDKFVYIIDEDGSNFQYSWPLHMFKWVCPPGFQLLGTHRNYKGSEIAGEGGHDAIFADMQRINEELFPGFTDAIVDVRTQTHKHHWSSPLLVGPKLPRRVDSVKGLYFVGDGSGPPAGIFIEAAAGAGVLGARTILADGAE